MTKIDKIIYNNRTYEDPKDISDKFNEFYIQLTNSKNFKYNKDEINKTIDTNNEHTIFLKPTDSMEVFQVIKNLNNTNAAGVDNITTNAIKLCAPYICQLLCYLINLSFEEGNFPHILKKSIVKPLLKKGEKSDVNNYRPVTLIPIMSKIFEKIMLKRLQDFTTSHRLLKDEQYGFRQNSTTSLACFNLIKIITQAINDGVPIAAIFLDMSKAFDFVDHNLLLYKLEKYGIRGKANDWLRNYLSDRKQCVEISKINKNNKKMLHRSDYRQNNFGVPQGTVLAAFLFLIYINDLPNITCHNTILFADDTTLIVKCENPDSYELEINNAINNIIQWLHSNNLQINMEKTKMIQFHTHKRKPLTLNAKYNDTIIEEVQSTKFLGIMLDQNCDWKAQVEYVCDKLDRFVYAIKRLRVTVSTETALCAYHGYVSSVLAYGLLLWGNSVDIIKVFRIQKKCVRAICGAWYMDSCKPLFKKYNILPLPCMYIRELCLFVQQHPKYFIKHKDVTKRNVAPRNKNKFKHELCLPQCRLELHKRNSYINAVKVYNKLPDAFKDLPLRMFKKKLTEWLKEKCFYDLNEYMSDRGERN